MCELFFITTWLLLVGIVGLRIVLGPLYKNRLKPKDDVTNRILEEFKKECDKHLPGSLIKKCFHLKCYECTHIMDINIFLFEGSCICHWIVEGNTLTIYGYVPDENMSLVQVCELVSAYYQLDNGKLIKVYIRQMFTACELRTVLMKYNISLLTVRNVDKNIYSLRYD